MPEREAAIEDAAELGQALARRMVRGTLDEYLAAWREYQCNCVKLSNWVLAALLIYADEPGLREALKGFARDALGPGEYLQRQVSGEWIEVDKVHALTKALVENHLKGWKDWRQADNPLAWIASVARSIGLEMATEDASLGQERQTVNGQQNQVSKQIYADKHNAVTRPTPGTEVGARR